MIAASFQRALERAARASIPAPICARALQLVNLHGATRQAIELLELAVDIVKGGDLHWTALDTLRVLTTEQERRAALSLVRQAARSARRSSRVELLTAIELALEQPDPRAPEAARFVENGLRTALEQRGATSQSRRKHFATSDARETLVTLLDVFDQQDRRFFLDRGTLLGAVRSGDLIANDYDIDLGVFADELSLDALTEMLETTRFAINHVFEHKVGALSPWGIQVDFFLTTRAPGYFFSKGSRNIHNWFFSPFELMEFSFIGRTFWVPDAYERHLHENYGNWRTPVIHYDLSYNEPCVAYEPSAEAIEYLSRRMGDALRAGDRYLAETPAVSLRRHFGIDFTEWFPSAADTDARPKQLPRRGDRPIIVVDDCNTLSHRLRRVLESALSIARDVHLAVPPPPRAAVSESASTADRLTVAQSIDRITSTYPIDHVDQHSLKALLELEPCAVVLPASDYARLSVTAIRQAHGRGCEVIAFHDDDEAVTLDHRGRVTVRRRGEMRARDTASAAYQLGGR